MKTEKINVRTSKKNEFIDITSRVQDVIGKSHIQKGLCVVFVPHTTAGITINENADPCVQRDIIMGLEKMLPEQNNYTHTEGNSAAHSKASLMGFSVTVFFENGALALGTWQGIYFAEFDGPRVREAWIRIVE